MIAVFACRVGTEHDTLAGTLLQRLDDQERARAARFVFARDRRAFVVAHALLRFALVSHGVRWDARIAADAHGKPRLDPRDGTLRFSLTHTDGLVAVAVAQDHDVGVDAEAAARDPGEAALRALALAASEIAELDGTADRRQRLLRLWVAKEAVAKAVGLGLALPIQQVVLASEPPRIASLPPACGPVEGWSLHTARHGAHWIGLAAPVAAMRFALHEVDPAALIGAGEVAGASCPVPRGAR
jgi:4'-phosphopantetheinyl transferase